MIRAARRYSYERPASPTVVPIMSKRVEARKQGRFPYLRLKAHQMGPEAPAARRSRDEDDLAEGVVDIVGDDDVERIEEGTVCGGVQD